MNGTEQYAVIGSIDSSDRPNTEMFFIGEYKACIEVNQHITEFLSDESDTNEKETNLAALKKFGVVLSELSEINVYGIIRYNFVPSDDAYAESKIMELRESLFNDKQLTKFVNEIYEEGFEDGVNDDECNSTSKTKV